MAMGPEASKRGDRLALVWVWDNDARCVPAALVGGEARVGSLGR